VTKTCPVLPVSLIVVSDYLGDDSDDELERSLAAYAGDPFGVPDEIIVMIPEGMDPGGKLAVGGAAHVPVAYHAHPSDESSQLKDAGLAHCRNALVAVAEADCLPEPGWLKRLSDAMQDDPSIEVVSGRTIYGRESMLKRVMALMDRGFIERPDRRGRIIHASNNGALYRRAVLERYKYAPETGPFVSAHLRQKEMVRDGVRMAIEPAAVSVHAFGGWRFLWDVRRNKGYQFARMRMLRKASRRAGLGVALLATAVSWKADFRTAVAVGGQYCRWTDWPLLAAMMLLVRIPEFMGALSAGSPDEFKVSTSYR
jgi:hypothetical protein